MKTAKCISRASAWVLLAGMILLGLSGWGITHAGFIYQATFGLIDRGSAYVLHRALNIPVSIILIIHVLSIVRMKLDRIWHVSPWIINITIITIGIAVMVLVIYVDLFS